MKNFKEMKYLLLDLDGVCYGKHNNYSLEKVFGQVSQRMTMFISERLKIDMEEVKEKQIHGGERAEDTADHQVEQDMKFLHPMRDIVRATSRRKGHDRYH